jgi:hypothetical protein
MSFQLRINGAVDDSYANDFKISACNNKALLIRWDRKRWHVRINFASFSSSLTENVGSSV